MSALERPMVAVVSPDEVLRELLEQWGTGGLGPFALRLPDSVDSACRVAPSERLRAQIAAGNPARTQITACLLPEGHAGHARSSNGAHVGVLDGPGRLAFRLYQWVIL